MTAMRVTPGLGTWVLDSPGAGGQTGTRAEGFSRSLAPTSHGPGSQARRAQGQEGLGVPRLRLRGDRQAVGRRPPPCSPKPHTLASTSASPGHRGEFPGHPVPPWRGRAGHSCGPWSPHPPLPPGLVEGVLLEASTGVSPSAVRAGVLPGLVSAAPVVCVDGASQRTRGLRALFCHLLFRGAWWWHCCRLQPTGGDTEAREVPSRDSNTNRGSSS